MGEGPEMALRRWNFVMVVERGRLFPLSRFIIREDGFGRDCGER